MQGKHPLPVRRWNRADLEENMGEWKTVFDGEVEGCPVMVKIYESEAGEPAVRLTTVPIVMARGRISFGAGVW
jgi:hypothetical protein